MHKPAGLTGPYPVLQVALDFLDTDRALKLAYETLANGADWLEIGTPLLKSEGLNAIRTLRKNFPSVVLIADLKTMDAGKIEFEAAAKAGANICVVMAAASDSTILQCVSTAKQYGLKTYCDMLGIDNLAIRAQEVAKLGVDIIGIHLPIDEQMLGKSPLEKVSEVSKVINIPIAVAGGVTSENASLMVQAGASIVIVGGSLSKAADAGAVTVNLRHALDNNKIIKNSFGKRISNEDLFQHLANISTSNLSDALYRQPSLRDIVIRTPGLHMAGRALTVRSLPGDWNKVVQAIDIAEPGTVLVIDCGGHPPAVWGELATLSAKNRNLAGAVINGSIRDTSVSTKLGFPLFSRAISSDAGDPKGLGEIGVRVTISGQVIETGDWIVGDDDGVIVLPSNKAIEYTNRGMDVLEAENRLRSEIISGKTLSEVVNLKKWEKVQ